MKFFWVSFPSMPWSSVMLTSSVYHNQRQKSVVGAAGAYAAIPDYPPEIPMRKNRCGGRQAESGWSSGTISWYGGWREWFCGGDGSRQRGWWSWPCPWCSRVGYLWVWVCKRLFLRDRMTKRICGRIVPEGIVDTSRLEDYEFLYTTFSIIFCLRLPAGQS